MALPTALSIRINRKVIRKGVRNDCHKCALALAIHAAQPGLTEVRVGNNEALVTKDNEVARYMLPSEARLFVKDIDDGGFGWTFKCTLNQTSTSAVA